jgi:phospho-N-acetylmuramoyl-pentapeptide-transferase
MSTEGELLRAAAWAGVGAALVIPAAWGYLGLARRRRWHQPVRPDGPQTHLAKRHTPSLGGVTFLLIAAVPVWQWKVKGGAPSPQGLTEVAGLLCAGLGLGLIGLWDDLAKLRQRRSRGVKARWRLAGQVAVAGLAVYFFERARSGAAAATGWLGVGWIGAPWATWLRVAAIVGCANAVNFTDGLDGLAAGTVAIAAAGLASAGRLVGAEDPPLSALWALAGGCAGFLLFNWHPAKLFMGDVGSMFLGGLLGGSAVALRLELLLVVVGGIFVAETLSVIAQVVYFRLTGGKRLLKMCPLHHHLELSGWGEVKIVVGAYGVAVALAGLGVAVAKAMAGGTSL